MSLFMGGNYNDSDILGYPKMSGYPRISQDIQISPKIPNDTEIPWDNILLYCRGHH